MEFTPLSTDNPIVPLSTYNLAAARTPSTYNPAKPPPPPQDISPPSSNDGSQPISKTAIIRLIVEVIAVVLLYAGIFYYMHVKKKEGTTKGSSPPMSSEPQKQPPQNMALATGTGGGTSTTVSKSEKSLEMEHQQPSIAPPPMPRSNMFNYNYKETVTTTQGSSFKNILEQGKFQQLKAGREQGEHESVPDKTSAPIPEGERPYVSPSTPNKTLSSTSDEILTTIQSSAIASIHEQQGVPRQFKAEGGQKELESMPNKLSTGLPEEKRPHISPSTLNKTMASALDEILTTTQSSTIASFHEQQGVSRQLKAEGGQKKHESMPNKLSTSLPEEKRPHVSPSTPNKTMASASDEILTTTQSSAIASNHEQQGLSQQLKAEGGQKECESMPNKLSTGLPEEKRPHVSPSMPNKTMASDSDEILTTTQSSAIASIHEQQGMSRQLKAEGGQKEHESMPNKLSNGLPKEKRPHVSPSTPNKTLASASDEILTTTQSSTIASINEQQGVSRQLKSEGGQKERESVPDKTLAHLLEERRSYVSPSTPNKTLASASEEIITTTQSSAIASINEQQGLSQQLKTDGGQKEHESIPDKTSAYLLEEREPYVSPSTLNKTLASASDEILTTTQSSAIARINEQQGVSQQLKTEGGQKKHESVPDKTSAYLLEERRPYVSPSTPNKTLASALNGMVFIRIMARKSVGRLPRHQLAVRTPTSGGSRRSSGHARRSRSVDSMADPTEVPADSPQPTVPIPSPEPHHKESQFTPYTQQGSPQPTTEESSHSFTSPTSEEINLKLEYDEERLEEELDDLFEDVSRQCQNLSRSFTQISKVRRELRSVRHQHNALRFR